MNHCKRQPGHTPSKQQRLGQTGVLECYTCRSEFRSYHNLMTHRKEDHPSHKKCRYFLKGKCKFSGDECWYLHEDKITIGNGSSSEVCYECRSNFETSFDLMEHKKNKHQKLRPCKKFERGICERSAEECWNKHTSKNTMTGTTGPKTSAWSQPLQKVQQEDFHEKRSPTPPDQTALLEALNMINMKMDTMNSLAQRLQALERKNVSTANLNNLTVVKRSNKPLQALYLPVIANINPRSVDNKVKEFHAFAMEEEIDVVFMSESWEREDKQLNVIIELQDHEIISNVYQRKGQGGRPALIVNRKKFDILNLTNTTINIKWGVEVVWCLLTPKKVTPSSRIQRIACANVYCKPGSKHKSDLHDHIAEVYNILSTKYQRGLHFIIAGDTNELDLGPILSLSPNLTQIVRNPTRLDPVTGVEKMLDPVIMTLTTYYQTPQCLAPLDPDPDSNGKPSDHRIVVVQPISAINNQCTRSTRSIKTRPITQS